MSKMAVIVDSACNLPDSVLTKYNITRVPLSYTIDGDTADDPCSDKASLSLFQSGRLARKHAVSTSPPSIEDFQRYIVAKIKEGYTTILVQTVNRVQGETYNNANAAASAVKRKLGDRQDVSIRVMDSRTVFAGQALMVAETVRQTLSKKDAVQVRRDLDTLSTKIHTFIIPKSPLVALERSKKRNEKAVGWGQAFLANTLGIHPILCVVNDSSYVAAKVRGFEKAASQLFHHVAERINGGHVLSPIITVNYGGSVDELKALPYYAELKAVADSKKMMLMPSVMSIAGGIYTSVGSLSLGIATEPHEWS